MEATGSPYPDGWYGQEVTLRRNGEDYQTRTIQSSTGEPGGAATVVFEVPQQTAGSYTWSTYYPGDAQSNPETRTTSAAWIVNKAETQTTLEVNANEIAAPATVEAVATVTAPNSVPEGLDVAFQLDGETVETVPVAADGTASTTVQGLTEGRRKLTAKFAGDTGTYNASSQVQTIVVSKQQTEVELASSASELAGAESAELTATVTPATADGRVQFFSGEDLLGSAPVENGTATFPVSGLGTGEFELYAKYLGSVSHVAATSNTVTIASEKAETVTELTLSEGLVDVGGAVTATATIDREAASGWVRFSIDGTIAGTARVKSGAAELVIDPLAVGEHRVTAEYLGDAAHLPSVSDAATVIASWGEVGLETPRLSTTKQVYGAASRARVTVNVSGVDTGSVRFTAGSRPLGEATVSGGTATLTVPKALPVGTHTVTATLVGNADHAAVTRTADTRLTVSKARAKSISVSGKRFTKGTTPRVTVRVGKLDNGAYPVGKVRVTVGATKKTVSLSAAKKGRVTVKLTKKYRKGFSVTATFLPKDAKNVAKAASKKTKVRTK
nr:Ig-like domain-containing protein [Leucobacter weissii]